MDITFKDNVEVQPEFPNEIEIEQESKDFSKNFQRYLDNILKNIKPYIDDVNKIDLTKLDIGQKRTLVNMTQYLLVLLFKFKTHILTTEYVNAENLFDIIDTQYMFLQQCVDQLSHALTNSKHIKQLIDIINHYENMPKRVFFQKEEQQYELTLNKSEYQSKIEESMDALVNIKYGMELNQYEKFMMDEINFSKSSGQEELQKYYEESLKYNINIYMQEIESMINKNEKLNNNEKKELCVLAAIIDVIIMSIEQIICQCYSQGACFEQKNLYEKLKLVQPPETNNAEEADFVYKFYYNFDEYHKQVEAAFKQVISNINFSIDGKTDKSKILVKHDKITPEQCKILLKLEYSMSKAIEFHKYEYCSNIDPTMINRLVEMHTEVKYLVHSMKNDNEYAKMDMNVQNILKESSEDQLSLYPFSKYLLDLMNVIWKHMGTKKEQQQVKSIDSAFNRFSELLGNSSFIEALNKTPLNIISQLNKRMFLMFKSVGGLMIAIKNIHQKSGIDITNRHTKFTLIMGYGEKLSEKEFEKITIIYGLTEFYQNQIHAINNILRRAKKQELQYQQQDFKQILEFAKSTDMNLAIDILVKDFSQLVSEAFNILQETSYDTPEYRFQIDQALLNEFDLTINENPSKNDHPTKPMYSEFRNNEYNKIYDQLINSINFISESCKHINLSEHINYIYKKYEADNSSDEMASIENHVKKVTVLQEELLYSNFINPLQDLYRKCNEQLLLDTDLSNEIKKFSDNIRDYSLPNINMKDYADQLEKCSSSTEYQDTELIDKLSYKVTNSRTGFINKQVFAINMENSIITLDSELFIELFEQFIDRINSQNELSDQDQYTISLIHLFFATNYFIQLRQINSNSLSNVGMSDNIFNALIELQGESVSLYQFNAENGAVIAGYSARYVDKFAKSVEIVIPFGNTLKVETVQEIGLMHILQNALMSAALNIRRDQTYYENNVLKEYEIAKILIYMHELSLLKQVNIGKTIDTVHNIYEEILQIISSQYESLINCGLDFTRIISTQSISMFDPLKFFSDESAYDSNNIILLLMRPKNEKNIWHDQVKQEIKQQFRDQKEEFEVYSKNICELQEIMLKIAIINGPLSPQEYYDQPRSQLQAQEKAIMYMMKNKLKIIELDREFLMPILNQVHKYNYICESESMTQNNVNLEFNANNDGIASMIGSNIEYVVKVINQPDLHITNRLQGYSDSDTNKVHYQGYSQSILQRISDMYKTYIKHFNVEIMDTESAQIRQLHTITYIIAQHLLHYVGGTDLQQYSEYLVSIDKFICNTANHRLLYAEFQTHSLIEFNESNVRTMMQMIKESLNNLYIIYNNTHQKIKNDVYNHKEDQFKYPKKRALMMASLIQQDMFNYYIQSMNSSHRFVPNSYIPSKFNIESDQYDIFIDGYDGDLGDDLQEIASTYIDHDMKINKFVAKSGPNNTWTYELSNESVPKEAKIILFEQHYKLLDICLKEIKNYVKNIKLADIIMTSDIALLKEQEESNKFAQYFSKMNPGYELNNNELEKYNNYRHYLVENIPLKDAQYLLVVNKLLEDHTMENKIDYHCIYLLRELLLSSQNEHNFYKIRAINVQELIRMSSFLLEELHAEKGSDKKESVRSVVYSGKKELSSDLEQHLDNKSEINHYENDINPYILRVYFHNKGFAQSLWEDKSRLLDLKQLKFTEDSKEYYYINGMYGDVANNIIDPDTFMRSLVDYLQTEILDFNITQKQNLVRYSVAKSVVDEVIHALNN